MGRVEAGHAQNGVGCATRGSNARGPSARQEGASVVGEVRATGGSEQRGRKWQGEGWRAPSGRTNAGVEAL
jgi:hypothetical protein